MRVRYSDAGSPVGSTQGTDGRGAYFVVKLK